MKHELHKFACIYTLILRYASSLPTSLSRNHNLSQNYFFCPSVSPFRIRDDTDVLNILWISDRA